MNQRRLPRLHQLYHQYLLDQDSAAFVRQVLVYYNAASLERVSVIGNRLTRRAAVFALGLAGDYESNATLGRALHDDDRGVRTLADSGIRSVWRRSGSRHHRRQLAQIVRLNEQRRFHDAIRHSDQLLAQAPWLAETWNQRAVARFSVGKFHESIEDCVQALELNPYHFGAAAGMGQCYMQLHDRAAALESFRRALKLNPTLEAVRVHVEYLQRSLKERPH